jgi:hypothetical protein
MDAQRSLSSYNRWLGMLAIVGAHALRREVIMLRRLLLRVVNAAALLVLAPAAWAQHHGSRHGGGHGGRHGAIHGGGENHFSFGLTYSSRHHYAPHSYGGHYSSPHYGGAYYSPYYRSRDYYGHHYSPRSVFVYPHHYSQPQFGGHIRRHGH